MARPKLYDKRKLLTVSCSEKHFMLFDALAKASGRTRSLMLREWIEHFAKQQGEI